MTRQVFGSWNGTVSVESFEVGWFTPLRIRNLRVVDQREVVLEIESIQTDLTFADLINRSGELECYRVDGVRLKLLDEGQGTNIERIIPIDPESHSRIEITNATIEMFDQQAVRTATVEDAILNIEIGKRGNVPTLVIEPTALLTRKPMKLELRPHLPQLLQGFFRKKYTDAVVSTRILYYRDQPGQSQRVESKTELVIHEIRLENPKLEAAFQALIRQYTRQPDDSPDLAVINITRSGATEKIEWVGERLVH